MNKIPIRIKIISNYDYNFRVREETDGDVWMLFKGSQPPQNWTDDVKFEGPAHLKPRAGIPFEVAFRYVGLRGNCYSL